MSKSVRKIGTNNQLFSLEFPVTMPAVIKNPINIVKLNFKPEMRSTLVDIILKHGDEQNHSSNVKADMTSWFMHEIDDSFKEIANQAIKIAHDNSPSAVALTTYDCWGAVYKKGDWTKNHDHWPQIWSWVYNVDCCDSCAPLVFHDSRDEKNPNHAYSLVPKTGRFTMFPGWIKHSVPVHQCNHNRIIVAGNISADPHHVISGIKNRRT